MIKTSKLTKYYSNVLAVDGLDISIDSGEVVGLLGPNGAGKTTTIRMLTTFLQPSSGSASVAGYDTVREADGVRKNIGYLPETPPLYPELRVDEYLHFIAKLRGIKSKQIREHVSQALERCALTDVRHKLCSQLSKGYRQRVGLAQALVHLPKVIILDEPTSGLDPAQIIEMRELIASLRTNHTVILSTHILPEVSQTCSKVVIIAKGKMVAQGSIEELTKEQSLEQLFIKLVSGEKKLVDSREV